MGADVIKVVVLECFVIALMEVDDDGQNFAETHAARFVTVREPQGHPLFSPSRFKLLAEFIDEVE
jgi:hypothetical protein